MDTKPPWEQLQTLAASNETLQPDIRGDVHPSAIIQGVLQLGEGSEIKAGTVIEGHVSIGRHCSIGPNAYVRGHTRIGDHCHIGHAVEIKSSILGNHVSVAHLSYIGDSVLGDDINVGGGCIFSNFRHDAGEIRMPWRGQLIPTGRNKLGCSIGSHSRIGCQCTILPGRVLPKHSQTMPGSVIR